jgi:hypothetical protein
MVGSFDISKNQFDNSEHPRQVEECHTSMSRLVHRWSRSGLSMTGTGLKKSDHTGPGSLTFTLIAILSLNNDNCCGKLPSNAPYVFFARSI